MHIEPKILKEQVIFKMFYFIFQTGFLCSLACPWHTCRLGCLGTHRDLFAVALLTAGDTGISHQAQPHIEFLFFRMKLLLYFAGGIMGS